MQIVVDYFSKLILVNQKISVGFGLSYMGGSFNIETFLQGTPDMEGLLNPRSPHWSVLPQNTKQCKLKKKKQERFKINLD